LETSAAGDAGAEIAALAGRVSDNPASTALVVMPRTAEKRRLDRRLTYLRARQGGERCTWDLSKYGARRAPPLRDPVGPTTLSTRMMAEEWRAGNTPFTAAL
jgi:hypothetical protein